MSHGSLRDLQSLFANMSSGADHAKAKSMVTNVKWTKEDDSNLECAVHAVAKKRCVDPPTWRELQNTFYGGQFVNDSYLEFWLYVSRKISSKSATECYLRFYELHGSPVARYSATLKSSKNGVSRTTNQEKS